MKLASPALQAFLGTWSETGAPAAVFMTDLFTFVSGAGRVVLNERDTPQSNSVTVTPPPIFGFGGKFLEDLGVREEDGTPLVFVTGGPSAGQYSVSIDSQTKQGIYAFGDNKLKLISYAFQIGDIYGLPTPQIIRLCSGDYNITLWGKMFMAGGFSNDPANPRPLIQRTKIRQTIGMEVSQQEIDIYAEPENQVDNLPLLQQIAAGFLDGAAVYVQRLISTKYGDTTMGTIITFSGTVAEAEVKRASARLTIKARTEMLNLMMPRTLYQPGCRHVLFDAGCRLKPEDYLITGRVMPDSTPVDIKTNIPEPLTLPNGVQVFGRPIPPPRDPEDKPVLEQIPGGKGVNLGNRLYFVTFTFVSDLGETSINPLAYYWQVATGDHLLFVHSPADPMNGALGYNIYVGLAIGDWMLQNTNPLPFSTDPLQWWTEEKSGLVQGLPPPLINTGGWFDQGVITFTSGDLQGLSRLVTAYGVKESGQVTVIPPLPTAPVSGDEFNILPGCSKSQITCDKKFHNLINYGGTPYIPQPEVGI